MGKSRSEKVYLMRQSFIGNAVLNSISIEGQKMAKKAVAGIEVAHSRSIKSSGCGQHAANQYQHAANISLVPTAYRPTLYRQFENVIFDFGQLDTSRHLSS